MAFDPRLASSVTALPAVRGQIGKSAKSFVKLAFDVDRALRRNSQSCQLLRSFNKIQIWAPNDMPPLTLGKKKLTHNMHIILRITILASASLFYHVMKMRDNRTCQASTWRWSRNADARNGTIHKTPESTDMQERVMARLRESRLLAPSGRG